MASINDRIGKYELNEYVARMRGVQFTLETKARYVESRARAIHASHRHDGVSLIARRKGEIDHYVLLIDASRSNRSSSNKSHGQGDNNSAFSIEFGRPRKGDMAPLHILYQAAGLA